MYALEQPLSTPPPRYLISSSLPIHQMKIELLDRKPIENILRKGGGGGEATVSFNDPSQGGNVSYNIISERMDNSNSDKKGLLDSFRPIVRNEVNDVACIGPPFAGAINIVQTYIKADPANSSSSGSSGGSSNSSSSNNSNNSSSSNSSSKSGKPLRTSFPGVKPAYAGQTQLDFMKVRSLPTGCLTITKDLQR